MIEALVIVGEVDGSAQRLLRNANQVYIYIIYIYIYSSVNATKIVYSCGTCGKTRRGVVGVIEALVIVGVVGTI